MRLVSLIVALLAGLDPAVALDDADRAALRAGRLVLGAGGQPVVSVRITESQRRVDFVADAAFSWGETAAAAGRWRVTVEGGRAGTLKYWTAVGQFAGPDAAGLRRAREKFPTATVLEGGAVFGSVDARVFTLVTEPQSSKRAARRQARATASRHGVRTWVIADLDTPAGGTIVARHRKTGQTVRAAETLWLTGSGPIAFPRLQWGHGTPKRGRAKRVYSGDLYFTVGVDGRLTVVNVLPAERIVEGVVPSEIYPRAPAEALAAQAIAARGQLLAKVSTRHRADPYTLCAETHCQKYTGDTRHDSRTSAAVRATAGVVLYHEEGLVDTVYSSTCGGYREASDQMWSGPPRGYLAGGTDGPVAGPPVTDPARFIDSPPDAWCSAGSRFRWTRTVTEDLVRAGVKKHRDIGRITQIEPLRRGHSGRVMAVRYHGASGVHTVEGSYRNRTLLGRLPSGMWVATPVGSPPTEWTFRGGGFGHGVGMCQLGAIGMAKAGHDHGALLRHYYPGARLEVAW